MTLHLLHIGKGLAGKKISPGQAFLFLTIIWVYSIGVQSAPLLGWGSYKAEGLLMTCSYDFLTDGINERTFLLFAYIFNYFMPMTIIGIIYLNITKAVVAHEISLKNQALKMNVNTLRYDRKLLLFCLLTKLVYITTL